MQLNLDKMKTIIYNGKNYNLEKTSGNCKIFVEDDGKMCVVTDLDNKVLVEIFITIVDNLGFIGVF